MNEHDKMQIAIYRAARERCLEKIRRLQRVADAFEHAIFKLEMYNEPTRQDVEIASLRTGV